MASVGIGLVDDFTDRRTFLSFGSLVSEHLGQDEIGNAWCYTSSGTLVGSGLIEHASCQCQVWDPPQYAHGDVVGCGFDEQGHLFITKNGKKEHTCKLFLFLAHFMSF